MRKRLSLALSLGLLSLPAQAKPPILGALFSLTVMEKGVERKVDPKETLPAGSRVRLHVEAKEQPCTIVATGFQAGKTQEIPALPPLLFSLKPAEEAANEFRLRQPLKAAELFVVVVPQHSGVTRELSQWVSSWKANADGSQAARISLHGQFNGWIAKQDQETEQPYPNARSRSLSLGDSPIELYDWHNEADGLVYTPEKPVVFVYHLGGKP